MKNVPNLAHALDAGLRLCFIRASLARASERGRSATEMQVQELNAW